jgi:PST family polysaccharide transporter
VVAPLEHLVLHSDSRGVWGLAYLVLDGVAFLLVYAVALRVLAPAASADLADLVAGAWRRVSLRRRALGAPRAWRPARVRRQSRRRRRRRRRPGS